MDRYLFQITFNFLIPDNHEPLPLNSLPIVFIAGIAELWLAIPLGLILKLSPLSTAVTTALGSVISAFIVAFAGENLRKRFLKWRYCSDEEVKRRRTYHIGINTV